MHMGRFCVRCLSIKIEHSIFCIFCAFHSTYSKQGDSITMMLVCYAEKGTLHSVHKVPRKSLRGPKGRPWDPLCYVHRRCIATLWRHVWDQLVQSLGRPQYPQAGVPGISLGPICVVWDTLRRLSCILTYTGCFS